MSAHSGEKSIIDTHGISDMSKCLSTSSIFLICSVGSTFIKEEASELIEEIFELSSSRVQSEFASSK